MVKSARKKKRDSLKANSKLPFPPESSHIESVNSLPKSQVREYIKYGTNQIPRYSGHKRQFFI